MVAQQLAMTLSEIVFVWQKKGVPNGKQSLEKTEPQCCNDRFPVSHAAPDEKISNANGGEWKAVSNPTETAEAILSYKGK